MPRFSDMLGGGKRRDDDDAQGAVAHEQPAPEPPASPETPEDILDRLTHYATARTAAPPEAADTSPEATASPPEPPGPPAERPVPADPATTIAPAAEPAVDAAPVDAAPVDAAEAAATAPDAGVPPAEAPPAPEPTPTPEAATDGDVAPGSPDAPVFGGIEPVSDDLLPAKRAKR